MSNNKHTTTGKLAIIAMSVAGATQVAEAGSATANLDVSANVSSKCTISTAPVAFSYDPVVTNNGTATGADAAATGSVSLVCTKGDPAHSVSLNFGIQPTGTQRKLKSAANNTLNYQLYTDVNKTAIWADGTSSTSTVSFSGFTTSSTTVTNTVYGFMTKGQDAPAGSYTDTVVATVNF